MKETIVVCSKCHNQNKANSVFCSKCGTKLEKKEIKNQENEINIQNEEITLDKSKKEKSFSNKKNVNKENFFKKKLNVKNILLILVSIILLVCTIIIIIDYFQDGPVKTKLICDSKQTIQTSLNATVKVIGEFGSGSGFFISPMQIITNNHVIEGMTIGDEIEIELRDEYKIKGKIIGGDAVADIAIIQTNKYENAYYLQWASRNISQGDELWVIGYPLSDQKELAGEATVTNGLLSATRTDNRNNIEYIQTNASIKYGNSGGPIVNKCGKVVAVSDFIYKFDETTDSIAFGVSYVSAKKSVAEILASEHKIEGTQPSFQEDYDPIELLDLYYQSLNYVFATYDYGSDEYNNLMKEIYGTFFTLNRIKDLNFNDWSQQWDTIWFVEMRNVHIDNNNPHKVYATIVETASDQYQTLDKSIEVSWQLDYSLGMLLLDKYEELGDAAFSQYIDDETLQNIADIKAFLDVCAEVYKANIDSSFNELYLETRAIFDRLNKKWETKTPFDENDYADFDKLENRIQILVKKTQDIADYLERQEIKNEIVNDLLESMN